MQKIVSRFILYSDFGKDAIITKVADICKDAKRLKEFESSANAEESIDSRTVCVPNGISYFFTFSATEV